MTEILVRFMILMVGAFIIVWIEEVIRRGR
jgi:hypothetical protein